MIYLHVPFCHRKCTYCAFYSVVTSQEKQSYVDALCRELALRQHTMDHPITTVYFGGGTPSILVPEQLAQIVETLQSNYDLSHTEEVTLEANPEDLTPQYLEALRAMGFFNRLSIGIQSFHDEDLRLLNRRHDGRQALQAVENAVEAGFSNISIDLIYGLPGQGLTAWRDNLDRVATLPVQHLSAYALTLEKGTILEKQVEQGRVATATEGEVLDHYESLLEWARSNGFEQYEISNFSKPGFRARHNSRYWNRTPYLGVGAAAHSFDGEYRRWNVADVGQYVASAAIGHIAHEEEQLGLKDAHNEYVMTALRTVEGIEKSQVALPFVTRLKESIARFVAAGLIEDTPTHYRPTHQGLLHADGIAAELFL